MWFTDKTPLGNAESNTHEEKTHHKQESVCSINKNLNSEQPESYKIRSLKMIKVQNKDLKIHYKHCFKNLGKL